MRYQGQEVDLVPILRDMGVTGHTGGGAELSTHCPLHEDHNPSFSINLETGLWICYSGCGGGSIAHLAQRLGYPRIVLEARLQTGTPLDPYEYLQHLLAQPEREQEGRAYYVPPLAEFQSDVLPRWFTKRGFTGQMVIHWDIHYDPVDGAVVIPAKDDYGKFVAVIKRMPPGVKPRYLYTPGFQKSRHLFGMWLMSAYIKHQFKGPLIITEGSLDAIWAHEMTGGWPALALLGATISDWQLNWLKQLDIGEVILAFDADVAGRELTEVMARALGVYTSIVTFPPSKKDVQECTREELREAIRQRRPAALRRAV